MAIKYDYTLWLKIFQTLNEAQKRWFAAEKSLELGYGGVKKISELTGLSRTTITKGISELKSSAILTIEKIRKSGCGRKRAEEDNDFLIKEIEMILEENTAGDPMSLLKWTCKSTRNIADELNKKGFNISYRTVFRILKDLNYSLQVNKKAISSSNNYNRDEQFRYINEIVKEFISLNEPIISVDTKKKELVGNFKNNGQKWHQKNTPIKVEDHDFRSRAKGIAIPYGTYDQQRNEGFVNIGKSSDTAEFAVNSIKQWWQLIGSKQYPKAKKLLICADGGGSNGSRSRGWKFYLQHLVDELGLEVTVCHYPPGTSKWNKIEHRMFSFISLNWKGIPLESYETIVNLIGCTKTKKGLKIKAQLDDKEYEKGVKISNEEFDQINLARHSVHPNWNYTISPKPNTI